MARKLTQEEIENNIKNKISELEDLELVSISYKNSKVKPINTIITLRCTKHDEIFTITYSAFIKNGGRCKKCHGENIRNVKMTSSEDGIKLINEYIEKANNAGASLEFISLVGDWKGINNTRILIKCNKHNTTTETNLQTFLRSNSWKCPECVKEYMSKTRRYTPQEARKAVESKFPNNPLDFSKIEETYENNESEVTICCEKHGDFKRKFSSLIDSDNPQCPECFHESISYSKEQALEIVKEKIKQKNDNGADLEFLGFVDDVWEGSTTKLILKCNKHNHIWNTTNFNNFCKDNFVGCIKCKGDKTREIHSYTPEQAYKLAKEAQSKRTDGRVYDLEGIKSTYTKSDSDVTICCEEHGDFKVQFTTLMLGKGICPECLSEKRSKLFMGNETIYLERINNKIQDLKSRGHNIQFLGFVETDTTKLTKRHLKLYCAEHNKYWETTTYDNFIGSPGVFCPDCVNTRSDKVSKMEKYCQSEILKYVPEIDTQHKIYLNEETKKILGNFSGILFADIYIESINAIIEYNGGQHYNYIEHFHKGDYSRLVKQVNRDLYLKQYCKENNIKLLIIPYVDDKRIPEIIERFITLGEDITTKLEPHLLPAIVENNSKNSHG